jgi:hypothetical protein
MSKSESELQERISQLLLGAVNDSRGYVSSEHRARTGEAAFRDADIVQTLVIQLLWTLYL